MSIIFLILSVIVIFTVTVVISLLWSKFGPDFDEDDDDYWEE